MFADRPGGLVYTSKLKPGAAGHKEERRLKWRRRLPGPQISISNLNLKSQTSGQYSHRKSPNLSSQISRLEGRPNLQSQILDLEQTRPQIPFGVGNLILQVSGL